MESRGEIGGTGATLGLGVSRRRFWMLLGCGKNEAYDNAIMTFSLPNFFALNLCDKGTFRGWGRRMLYKCFKNDDFEMVSIETSMKHSIFSFIIHECGLLLLLVFVET